MCSNSMVEERNMEQVYVPGKRGSLSAWKLIEKSLAGVRRWERSSLGFCGRREKLSTAFVAETAVLRFVGV